MQTFLRAKFQKETKTKYLKLSSVVQTQQFIAASALCIIIYFQLEGIYFLSDPEVRTIFPCILFACLQAHF